MRLSGRACAEHPPGQRRGSVLSLCTLFWGADLWRGREEPHSGDKEGSRLRSPGAFPAQGELCVTSLGESEKKKKKKARRDRAPLLARGRVHDAPSPFPASLSSFAASVRHFSFTRNARTHPPNPHNPHMSSEHVVPAVGFVTDMTSAFLLERSGA